MARIRSIHPDALKSEKLASLGAEAERLYWRIQTHCDDEGRAEDNPRLFRSFLFPLHDEITAADVDGWLDECADAGLLVRYEVDGGRYLAITRWGDYQHPQRKVDSKLPAPSVNGHPDSAISTRDVREDARTGTRGVEAGVGGEREIGEGEGGVVPTPAPDGAPPKKGRRKPEVPLPPDWEPSESTRAWARREYPEHATRAQLEAFRDHAAQTDRRARDWEAAFRNWIRKAGEFGGGTTRRAEPARTYLGGPG